MQHLVIFHWCMNDMENSSEGCRQKIESAVAQMPYKNKWTEKRLRLAVTGLNELRCCRQLTMPLMMYFFILNPKAYQPMPGNILCFPQLHGGGGRWVQWRGFFDLSLFLIQSFCFFQADPNGMSFQVRSCDNQPVTVKVREPVSVPIHLFIKPHPHRMERFIVVILIVVIIVVNVMSQTAPALPPPHCP